MSSLTFADIFSGIGGFRLSLEQAGLKCLYSCEANESCRQVYFENFGDYPDGDISEVDFSQIPDVNVVTAGFPCQPFSICGKRRGFSDERGTIFFYLCEFLKQKQPEVIILENVKHLLHVAKGSNFKVILNTLQSLGYLVTYKLLNAKDFGLPQNRERVFIVGSKYKKFDFSKLQKIEPVPNLKDFLDNEENFEYLSPDEYTLIENPKKQDSGLIFVGYRNKSIWKTGIRPNTEHLSRVHRQPNRIYSVDGVHPTLPSQESSGRFFIYLPEKNRVRKLTLKECYKIMGFPQEFKKSSVMGDAYRQIGNSVATTVVRELIREIIHQEIFCPSSRYQQDALVKQSLPPVQLTIPGL
ncbi:DNA cytosine methyltransferase [Baaleninema sp.]|uniref:DNA cytosine methyltransferase n=1 Tax=Baaleninema sp. TaxID=3101197 RepID=UPI003D04E7A0